MFQIMKCRSCDLAENYGSPTSHTLIDVNYTCVLCGMKSKWYSHIGEDWFGDAIECGHCHDYIIYLEKKIWKDEIYFDQKGDEILLMREFDSTETIIFINTNQVAQLPFILEKINKDNIINKINNIILFS